MKYLVIAGALLLGLASCQNQTKNQEQSSYLLTDSLNRSSSSQDSYKTVKVTKEFFDALSKDQHAAAEQCLDKPDGSILVMQLADSLKNYPNFNLDIEPISVEGAAGSAYSNLNAVISSGNKKLYTQITLRKSSLDSLDVWKVYEIKYL